MFNAIHSDSKSVCPTSASSPFPECTSDAMNEQSLSFTTTDMNIVEMTEIEYTQLQQILSSHMDPQNSEGDMEPKVNSAFFPATNCSSVPQCESANTPTQASFTACSSRGQTVRPILCQSVVTSESSAMNANQTLGHIDFQELRLMMLSESNMPLASNNTMEKIPNKSGGDTSLVNTLRLRQVDNVPGHNKENENLAVATESRSKSAVRVRLEDRFNSIQTDVARCQAPQEAGVNSNNVVTLIRHPSQLVGAQHQNKCGSLVKTRSSASPASNQFKYSAINVKNTQEMESRNQTLETQNKPLSEQVWIKMGVNKRSRSRDLQASVIIERRALSDIQNLEVAKSAGAPAVSWPPGKTDATEQMSSNKQGCSSQRREKHNRMERDRRRRIRVCCDELNHLVPFCNVETDKATTLQWTTAFLKYIHERNGDSLKKEFETVFCGKTGRRLKAARSEGLRTVQAQDRLHPDVK